MNIRFMIFVVMVLVLFGSNTNLSAAASTNATITAFSSDMFKGTNTWKVVLDPGTWSQYKLLTSTGLKGGNWRPFVAGELLSVGTTNGMKVYQVRNFPGNSIGFYMVTNLSAVASTKFAKISDESLVSK